MQGSEDVMLCRPYVPNPLDDKDPQSSLRLPYVPLAERNIPVIPFPPPPPPSPFSLELSGGKSSCYLLSSDND